ncbi:UBX domain-containing protein 1-like isoform X2 [Tubulanus polymorphus]|uniref:UBX domain-containing protein 1-like isoform X2 n=1 Tax=Tubulanus polymorphus TaxID=672921 RepID=UPI003DA4B7F0
MKINLILGGRGRGDRRVEKALKETHYKGVDVAMEWLFAHQDDPDPEPAPPSVDDEMEETPASSDTAMTAQQPMSLKCDDCGKLLRDEDAVQLHAARSGHSNFSESTEEIKPLTEEEKQEQLARIQEKLKEKRVEKAKKEQEEAREKEKLRRIQGRDLTAAKQKMKDDEMKQLAEQRRREKHEEKLARQKVREQIEEDKKARAAKFPKQGQQTATVTPASQPVPAPATASPAVKKTYDKSRIQIRLMDGECVTETFDVKSELARVRLFIQMKLGDPCAQFALMTTYPRKVFTDEDMEKPLSELGLVPSAVLIVTKQK